MDAANGSAVLVINLELAWRKLILSGGHLVMRDNSWILRVFEFEGNQVDEGGGFIIWWLEKVRLFHFCKTWQPCQSFFFQVFYWSKIPVEGHASPPWTVEKDTIEPLSHPTSPMWQGASPLHCARCFAWWAVGGWSLARSAALWPGGQSCTDGDTLKRIGKAWKSYQGYKASDGNRFQFFRLKRVRWVNYCSDLPEMFGNSLKVFWMITCLARHKSATHQEIMVNCEFNQWNAWRPMQWLLSKCFSYFASADRAHWFLGLQRCN